jgi:hypothetical protein
LERAAMPEYFSGRSAEGGVGVSRIIYWEAC